MKDNEKLTKKELLKTSFDLEIEEEESRNNLSWLLISPSWLLHTK